MRIQKSQWRAGRLSKKNLTLNLNNRRRTKRNLRSAIEIERDQLNYRGWNSAGSVVRGCITQTVDGSCLVEGWKVKSVPW